MLDAIRTFSGEINLEVKRVDGAEEGRDKSDVCSFKTGYVYLLKHIGPGLWERVSKGGGGGRDGLDEDPRL